MRDPRFRETEKWAHARDELCTAARQAFELSEMPEETVASLVATLEQEETDLDEDATGPSPELRREVRAFVLADGAIREPTWHAIAVALATIATRPKPSAANVQRQSERLRSAPWWVHVAFTDACAEAVNALPRQEREAWLDELERPLEVTPNVHGPTMPIEVSRREHPWQLLDVFDVWGDVPIAIEVISRYAPDALFRRLDESRWFRAVDSWSDARLVGGALFGGSALHDRERLLEWLRAASLVFDADGVWSQRSAAVFLVNNVLSYAEKLEQEVGPYSHDPEVTRRTQEEVARLRDEELPAFFERAWQALLARADGLPIAAALHARLCDPRKNARPQVSAYDVARRTLSTALASRGVRTATLRDLWAARRSLRAAAKQPTFPGHAQGVAALNSMADVLREGDLRDDDFFVFLLERVRDDDQGWAGLIHTNDFSPVLAQLLGVVDVRPDILMRCRQAYVDLEATRRRGERGRTCIESDNDRRSLVMLVILFGILDEGEVDEPTRLRILEDGLTWTTRLLLTSSPPSAPDLRVETVYVMAARVCARLAPARLPALLEVAVQDPPLAAAVAASLLDLLTEASLNESLRSSAVTLDDIERRASAWSDITRRPFDRTSVENLAQRRGMARAIVGSSQ